MTGQRNIRLLLADVDGTLVTPDKVLTEAAKLASRDLRRAGIALAVISARPPRGMRMLIEPLQLQFAIAGFNGGVLARPDLSVIETHILDPTVAESALRALLKLGSDVWVFTETEWFIRNRDAPHVAHEILTVKFDPKVVGQFDGELLARAVKIVGVSDQPSLMAECEKAVEEAAGKMASVACSQPYYLDITHPLANKGVVVETLSRLMDIPCSQIATIGDMPNDTLMFRKSGLSIAMGNACREVKAQADEITGSNENDGFAEAVRRFVLPPPDRGPESGKLSRRSDAPS